MSKTLSKIEQEIIIHNILAEKEVLFLKQEEKTAVIENYSVLENKVFFFSSEINVTNQNVLISFYYKNRLFGTNTILKKQKDSCFFEFCDIFYLDEELENSLSEIHADLYYSIEKDTIEKFPCIIPEKEIFFSYSAELQDALFHKIKKTNSVIKNRINPFYFLMINSHELLLGSYSEDCLLKTGDMLVLDLEIDSLKGKRKILGSFEIEHIFFECNKYLYLGKFTNIKREDQRFLEEKNNTFL